MRKPLALLTLTLAACTTSAKNTPATSTPSPSSPAAAAASASAGVVPVVQAESDAGAITEGPPKWRTVPKEEQGFYAALDGICSQLGMTRVGKDIVLHYGGNIMYGSQRIGPSSFIALKSDGLVSVGDPDVTSPTGIAGVSIDDFWVADSTGSRSSEGAVLHRRANGKWTMYGKDQTNLHAWVDGGIIGSLGFAAANGELWVEGSTTKPPEAFYADMPYPALAAFPTGDVIIVATKDHPDTQVAPIARHWSPATKITEHKLDKVLGSGGYPRVVEVAPDEVYAYLADRFARWDGTKWYALAKTPSDKIERVVRGKPDELWHSTLDGGLYQITPTKGARVPTPEPILSFDGVDKDALHIVGKSGKLYRREGEGWKEIPLPKGTFSNGTSIKAKSVVVVAPDDIVVTAMYWEKGFGWKDQELHTTVLRSKPVKETLRCNEPDPENNNVNLGRGFQSWAPMATAECKTPFAVLARRSNEHKREDDWPTIRKSLKGHPELGEVALVDFVSGDRTFVGAKAKDLDTAKKLVALVAKNDRLRPEIVCGDPDAKRTLAIDLATGNVAK